MADLFITLLDRSIAASWLVLFILLLRIILKRAPKWIRAALWALVGLRLVLPEVPVSPLSLLPSGESITPEIMLSPEPAVTSGVPLVNVIVNNTLSEYFAPNPATSANPLQLLFIIAAQFWLLGIVILLGYSGVSYLRLRRRVRDAVPHSDGVFLSEHIPSPFLLGIGKPKIYLPYFLEESAIDHVLAHEKAHIRRKDHWWKPLGFLLLSVYWFHPLMWVAYILLCRDIELACDEAAIREMDASSRADYSQALLRCSTHKSTVAACPLAFGETGIRQRIRSVLSYKKPGKIPIAAGILLLILAGVCFLTNPDGRPGEVKERSLSAKEKNDILQAYAVSFDELRWDKEDDSYYGNFDGYDFFLITDKRSPRGSSRKLSAGGETFVHSSRDFGLYGYRDGQFETLEQLHQTGQVSSDSVKALAQINNSGNPQNLPSLPNTLKTQTPTAWSAYYLANRRTENVRWEDNADDQTNTVFQYFCSAEGYDVFWSMGALQPAVMSGVTIGKYHFTYGTPASLYAYKSGRVYLLSDLYEDGKISEQSIAALYEKGKEVVT